MADGVPLPSYLVTTFRGVINGSWASISKLTRQASNQLLMHVSHLCVPRRHPLFHSERRM